jgi:hypothetical protein
MLDLVGLNAHIGGSLIESGGTLVLTSGAGITLETETRVRFEETRHER